MTNDKGNKLASLVVTFCSLIQILLVLLIAVKILISSFVISIEVHIFQKTICQALKLHIFSTLAREKCLPSVARPVDILTNTELVKSGACYWWRSARHGAHSYGTAGA